MPEFEESIAPNVHKRRLLGFDTSLPLNDDCDLSIGTESHHCEYILLLEAIPAQVQALRSRHAFLYPIMQNHLESSRNSNEVGLVYVHGQISARPWPTFLSDPKKGRAEMGNAERTS